MKSLFFSFMIMLCGVTTLLATSDKDNFKKFPEYDNSLNTKSSSLHHGCSGSAAMGNTCSATCQDNCNCSCSSGFFNCTCKCTCGEMYLEASSKQKHGSEKITITPTQYELWKQVGDILLSDNSVKGEEMYNDLVYLFEIAKKQNKALYEQKGIELEQTIKFHSEIRTKINNPLAKNNIDYRI